MTTQSENTKRIAKNTILLYVRMLFGMLVSLYTSRVIISALGVVDYGIYGVVGSFVTMFSLINGSLSASASRFLTFELGRGDMNKLKAVFSTSLLIHISLAVIVVLLLETVGLWFLNNKMVIPADRMFAANCVYQASVLSFVLGLLSVPYNASIVAHERMKAFAYIGILDILLRLGIVILVAHLPAACDRLIYYALLILALGFMMQYLYWRYCRKNFEECHLQLTFDKSCWKQMGSFAGWNFIGCTAGLLKDQGVNLLLNLSGGPVLNAARSIALSVNGAVCSFAGNFMTALNPQITKSYAAGQQLYMTKLVENGSRFSFYILLILVFPVLMETKFILSLWLGEGMYPAHTVNFVRLVLLLSMLDILSNTLITLQNATGKIRNYQIAVGGMLMMNFPLSYICLKFGFPPETVYFVAIFVSLCCLMLRLIFLRYMLTFSMRSFLCNVCVNVFKVSLLSSIIPLMLYFSLESGWMRFIVITTVCILCVPATIFIFGCSAPERQMVIEKLIMLKRRFANG